jgi:hypothetical protein
VVVGAYTQRAKLGHSAWSEHRCDLGADGPSQALGRCLALMAIVGAPLAVGSIVHLYPHAFFNVLVLVPVLIWCMFLLYRGLPVVLGTGPNRGMLMASALIAYLFVALVSLLGITVALWGSGIGPRIGA